MKERLFGIETEYGLTVVPSNGTEIPVEIVAGDLVDLARQRPHLPGLHSGGIFLANGSRFYVDCGAHPEFATPECANPWDICRYVQAGEQMLLGLAGQLPSFSKGIERTLILRNNTDYASRATWGCHESYLHGEMTVGTLSRQIIPHLVSRVVYTGAGGFDCHSPGIAFLVSPRVFHLQTAISGNSTGNRGIFHTRDESLCGKGYKRLHILCGESLCGNTATWLKVGTTALVVALIDAGKRPGHGIDLPDPLAAMRVFAADPTCKQCVRLANGRQITALDIQQHYMRQAEAHADADFMPPWAGEVCRRWRQTLDQLRTGNPAALSRTLDWKIKFALFENHLRRRGTNFGELAEWTYVVRRLTAARTEKNGDDLPLTAADVLASKGSLGAARKLLARYMEENGLAWEGLDAFLALRLELFELDTRFGILGDKGIFSALDRSGTLDHRLPGVDNVANALENPPAVGRASLRGTAIHRLAGGGGRFAAEWDGVFDLGANKCLNLSDPFCSAEQWDDIKPEPEDMLSRRYRALDLYLHGDYAHAEQILRTLLDARFEVPSNLTHIARLCLLTNRDTEARELVRRAWSRRSDGSAYLLPRMLWFHLLLELLDGKSPARPIGRLKTALTNRDAFCEWSMQPVLDHVTPRLPANAVALLTSLIGALSNPANMPELELIPEWMNQEPLPIGRNWSEN